MLSNYLQYLWIIRFKDRLDNRGLPSTIEKVGSIWIRRYSKGWRKLHK